MISLRKGNEIAMLSAPTTSSRAQSSDTCLVPYSYISTVWYALRCGVLRYSNVGSTTYDRIVCTEHLLMVPTYLVTLCVCDPRDTSRLVFALTSLDMKGQLTLASFPLEKKRRGLRWSYKLRLSMLHMKSRYTYAFEKATQSGIRKLI